MSFPFVVVFMARSGSTALYGNLRQLPNVMMRAEVFGNKELPEFGEQTDDNRIAFLRKYWSKFRNGPGGNDVRWHGFKFQVTADNTQFGNLPRLAKVMSEYKPKVIVLRRQNTLKQAISSVNAHRLMKLMAKEKKHPSGHVTADNTALLNQLKVEKMTIDIPHLKHTLAGIRQGQKKMNAFVERLGQHLEIFYEDYLADRNRVLAQVLAYLEIEVDPATVTDAYVKITDDDLSKSIENYDALSQFVAGTEYEAMI